MNGHSSWRGDAGKELEALMDNAALHPKTRLLFYEVLKRLNADTRRLGHFCHAISTREGLWAFDCLEGPENRARRPWAALAVKNDRLVLLHARASYTGGLAEKAAACSEAIARFDLEFVP